MKRYALLVSVLILLATTVFAVFQYTNSLTYKVQKAVRGKNCEVRAAVICKDKIWTFNNEKTPLMSVFKYFIALKVLDKIEKENLSLDDKIFVTETMISRTTYSPMLKRYTKTPFKISVSDLIKYMVSESDNNATDILLSYVGGITVLQRYLTMFEPVDIKISADEKMMEDDIQTQYLNTAKPLDVIGLMRLMREDKGYFSYAVFAEMFEKSFLSDEHKKFLVRIAENDAGFVILPNGETYYIAVFVAESKMSDSENHALAAQVSKIVYEYITAQNL